MKGKEEQEKQRSAIQLQRLRESEMILPSVLSEASSLEAKRGEERGANGK